MFQLISVFCFSLHLISWSREVLGTFRMRTLEEEGEYLSLDFVSMNSKDVPKFHQNINDAEQTYMVPPPTPVSRDFYKPIAEERTILEADDISLLHEWDTPVNPHKPMIQIENHQQIQHGGSKFQKRPPNSQELQNFYPENPWNTATEVLRFPGLNYQKENYPHAGPSNFQTSSSKTIAQPMIEESPNDGIHFNLAPYLDKLWYPDLSLAPQMNQNLEIPHNKLKSGNLAFQLILKDSLNSPRISKMRERDLDGNSNQGREALNLDIKPTFQNSGPINAKAKVNQLSKLRDNEKTSLILPKKRKWKVNQLELNKMESFEERLDLIRVLREEFSIGPEETSQNNEICNSKNYRFLRKKKKEPAKEARNQKYVEKNILKFLRENDPKEDPQPELSIAIEVKERLTKNEISTIDNRKRSKLIESAFRIQWNGFEILKKSITNFTTNFKDDKDEIPSVNTLVHIKNISTLGITFMKIISKKYQKGLVSDEFGDDQNLLTYNTLFWNFCFKNHEGNKDALRGFFESIRGNISKKEIDRFVSAKLSRGHNEPDVIFSQIKSSITKKTNKKQIILFSWYFVFFRAMVYYPELFFQSTLDGNQLKLF
ncbi:expressed protein, partial [Phakopsora pachyrhizi]